MAEGRLAAYQNEEARRRGANLLPMDERGLPMAPLVRRSWALKGHPPVIEQEARHREKVSIAAALWLPSSRDRLGLAYQTLVNGYFTDAEVAEFIGCAVAGLTGPVIAIWDRGPMHQGGPINQLLERSRGRLDIEPLPAYAPELTPAERLWTWLKEDRRCNFAPECAHRLHEVAVGESEAIRDDQERLRGFFVASDLPLPRALLTSESVADPARGRGEAAVKHSFERQT